MDLREKEFDLLLSVGVPEGVTDVTVQMWLHWSCGGALYTILLCYCPVCSGSSREDGKHWGCSSSQCSLLPKCSLSCLGELFS